MRLNIRLPNAMRSAFIGPTWKSRVPEIPWFCFEKDDEINLGKVM
jgi:hypothetical protein